MNELIWRSCDTLPMSVDNMAFLLDRMSKDCPPLQFVREFTKNGLDAMAGHCDGEEREIRWDVDWKGYESNGIRKLSVIDTGIGMTGPEMVNYINKLSSSIHQQSTEGNYGIGAKISAVPLNREGLVYLSWKHGDGAMIHLGFNQEDQAYGLRRYEANHGEWWTPIPDALKPDLIDEHGTMVVFLGQGAGEETILAPEGAESAQSWLTSYLNSRFFKFPMGVHVRAREGWSEPSDSKHNFLRTIHGMQAWLSDNSTSGGEVQLSGAIARWWILKDDLPRLSKGRTTPNGHVAILFQDELYETSKGKSGLAKLQSFGVVFGCKRVVVYVEPNTKLQKVEASTSRASLKIGENGEIPWDGWASEFRNCMPRELAALEETMAAAIDKSDRKSMRERLLQIKDLLCFTPYRRARDGEVLVDASVQGVAIATKATSSDCPGQPSKSPPGDKDGTNPANYSHFTSVKGAPATEAKGLLEPEVKWVSRGNDTRTEGDMEDRAAKYLQSQNLLLINQDCRIFTDMIDRWAKKFRHVPCCRSAIIEEVHEWFEQQLVETVMSAFALGKGGRWSEQECEKLLAEESLTAAVLPRYHIDIKIKTNLNRRLGKQPA